MKNDSIATFNRTKVDSVWFKFFNKEQATHMHKNVKFHEALQSTPQVKWVVIITDMSPNFVLIGTDKSPKKKDSQHFLNSGV